MKNSQLLLKVLAYMIFCIICSIPFFIPLLFFFPEVFTASKSEFANYMENDSVFACLSQLAILCGTLLATHQIVYKSEKKHFADYKLTINLEELLVGFVAGIAFFCLFIFLVYFTTIVNFSIGNLSSHLIAGLLVYLIVAAVEEIAVRGYILSVLRQHMNDYRALVVSSIIFGVIHFANDHITLIGFINISLAGFLFGLIFIRSQTICAPIGIHWSWNFVQGPVVGFNVSGNKEFGILDLDPQAPNFLTGGEFGAEGSLLLIPISLGAIYFVYKYYKFPISYQ